MAERGVPAERLGQDAGQVLRAELEGGAAVDVHAADQLLIYAAQARGPSRFTVRKVSRHARTVMWLIEQFPAGVVRGRAVAGTLSDRGRPWLRPGMPQSMAAVTALSRFWIMRAYSFASLGCAKVFSCTR